jgi:carnitine 3-dehydrogenase
VIQRVAVIGAGTIGASWATYFLARGLEVSAYDPSPDGEAFVHRFADTAWPTLQTLGWITPGANEQRLRFCREIGAALEGAQFVQESGPEDEGLKIALFAEMDAALSGDAVIASSSSGLLISRVTEKCRQPQRCVVGHPFNPPHLIPLVEVVGGAKTSPAAIETAMDFYRDIGKHPIHIKKEVRGHVANRLQAALWREAIHLVVEGVVSVADADAAIAYGPWPALGADGPAFDLPSRGRRRRHGAFHVASRRRAVSELDGRSRRPAAHCAGSADDHRGRRRGSRLAQHRRSAKMARPQTDRDSQSVGLALTAFRNLNRLQKVLRPERLI